MKSTFVLFSLFFTSVTSNIDNNTESEVGAAELQCPHLYDKFQAVCNLFPESIEGPYYLPNQTERSDVREDRDGIPLTLFVTLAEVRSCKALFNIPVDIWSADAMGEYSSFVGVGPEDPADRSGNSSFLRGYQRSDANGKLKFITIFPGWYIGRTVHLHMNIHLRDKKHSVQLYFPEKITQEIAQLSPYKESKKRRITNEEDAFYITGAQLKLFGSTRDGYIAHVLMAFRPTREKFKQ